MTKLELMLKYVSEHNDFYKKRIKEYGIKDPLDITQWPVLTRKELQENRYNMFSDGYKSKYFNQQLRRQSSSGSSGMPVNVYWDYKDWYASNMSLWRKRLQWYGIKPSDKYVIFTLNAFNIKNDGETVYYIKEPANILSVNVSLIQNESGYDKLVDIINEFEPKWLYIQPFVLNQLIQAYKRTEKTPPETLKYIESVGELLTSDLQRRTIDFFKVPLANMYGSEEMNGIAYECPEHHMHFLEDNVFFETTINSEATITNLNNYAMPLIRYNQGDEILIGQIVGSCPYEKSRTVLSSILGRKLDSTTVGGAEINSICLLEIMAYIINMYNDMIIGYRYTFDKSTEKFICYIELADKYLPWFASIKKMIWEVFSEKFEFFSDIDFEVRLEQETAVTNKKRRIIEIII